MIKFFRKIRQNLLSEGKTGKYFKYAIGEIVLVVIGILIALQINNWNEQRKDRTKEQIILKQLREDYQANLNQLEEKMATREKIIISGVALLEAFDNPQTANRDSVIKKLAIISNDPTFDPIQNNLNSSENLRLIRNVKLSRLLSNWSSDVVAVKEVEDVWSKIVYNQFDLTSLELGIGRDLSNSFMNEQDHLWLLDKDADSLKIKIGKSKLGATLNEILTNTNLEGVLGNAITVNKSANLQSEALHKRIRDILDIIEIELNK
ncbi:hypothetical protein KXJ69_08110 [Aureisphaera sp. CAU 1614]|uniref:Uncharacterized protein n=1 Tax=Halomarinibacterium sedimenti TaxID=2857106 RepID=A0A9X1FQN3_9FLAO|nr:DUF6090 family protein [Halomarinibacterium sedimenti]MBW2938067.1 hypothetical protein [Halomarinibacterium sedimenti]